VKIGAQAELFAAQFLQSHGLKLVVQNYHCRFGEIDLILHDGDTLVFAEVRLRSSMKFGGAAASIDPRKQRKLICTAQHYLSTLTRIPPCRFDALLLKKRISTDNISENNSPCEFRDSDIEWIKNAFSA
jgi:putative endonuclease